MNERQIAAVKEAKSASDDYIRSVAGSSPTQQIASAKALLDSERSPRTNSRRSRPRPSRPDSMTSCGR